MVREAPLLIGADPSLDLVSTVKNESLEGLSVLLGGTTSPSCVYTAPNGCCCHLGLLGGIRAALSASWKTIRVSGALMNSCLPSPQVYTVCLRGGQEARQRSLTRKRPSHRLLITLPKAKPLQECLNACCQGLEDLGKSCCLCLLSCSVPAESAAARRRPQTVSASLEAPEALPS